MLPFFHYLVIRRIHLKRFISKRPNAENINIILVWGMSDNTIFSKQRPNIWKGLQLMQLFLLLKTFKI